MTPDQQAALEQVAREWLQQRGLWNYDSPANSDAKALVSLLAVQRAAVLAEAANEVFAYNCVHDHGKAATHACDELEETFRQQAQEQRP